MVDSLKQWIRGLELDLWQKAAYALMVAYGLIILATFREYGITADEHNHVRYGSEIARWFGSLFQDRAIFDSRNTWLYGGAFDLLCHLASALLPLARYETNHLCNAAAGWLGVLGAYRIGCLLGGSRAGLLSALCLLLTPRYFGHAFNNPKDIPFAVGYLWSLYFLFRGLEALPDLSRGLIVKTGLAIGLTLGVRIGGLLLLGYLGFFFSIRLLQLGRSERLYRLLLKTVSIAVISYVVMVLFWPWAQVHPLSGPWQAIGTFARFSEYHYSFFDGQYVLNTGIPRTYALRWLALTLPEFVFVGLAGWMVCVISGKRSCASLPHLLLLIGGLFPVLVAVVTHMPLYDGIRHLMFVVPPLVVLGAIGMDKTLEQFAGALKYGAVFAGLLLGMAGLEMVRLHPNQYVYFNRAFAGGIEQAQADYETDYWSNSFKQGLSWIETHGERHPEGRKFRLGSLSADLLSLMADPDRFDCRVSPEEADLYMGGTRYDHHRAIPGEVVHVVLAGSAPLLYIVRPDSSFTSDPFFADFPAMYFHRGNVNKMAGNAEAALRDFEKVMEFYQNGVALGRPVEHLYVRLGNVHLDLANRDRALDYYQKALVLNPRDEAVYNNIGVLYQHQRDYLAAREWIQSALDINPSFLDAWMNLAEVLKSMNDPEGAVRAYREALKLQPESANIYGRLGRFFYGQRQFEDAVEHFRKAVACDPETAATHYNLGLALTGKKAYPEAAEAFRRAIEIDPGLFDGYYKLGAVLTFQRLFEEAKEAYLKAVELESDRADVLSDLGAVYVRQGRFKEARTAFERALRFQPDHTLSQNRLKEVLKLLD